MTPPAASRPRGSAAPTGDDFTLLERIRAGQRGAWEAFVSRYESLIYSVARRYGLSREDAGDVLQDTLAAFVRGLPRLRDARAVPRWLMQTAYRLSRDLQRSRRREPSPDDERVIESAEDPSPGPDRILEELEAYATLRAELSRLAPRCRDLLTALFLEDPTPDYVQIGARLGLPVGSIGPTRRRCLDRLLHQMAGIRDPSRIRALPRSTLESEDRSPPTRSRSRS